MRAEVEDWLRRLHDSGIRSLARAGETVWAYLGAVLPLLTEWSTRYQRLRQVTREDVLAVADEMQGGKRHLALSVLRSLFRHAKRTGAVFRDPTARIRIRIQPYGLILPLEPVDLREAVAAAATPAARLARALAAVHAARPKLIRELRLDDVDLPTGACSCPDRPAPSTSSPTPRWSTGWTTGAPAGRALPTRT